MQRTFSVLILLAAFVWPTAAAASSTRVTARVMPFFTAQFSFGREVTTVTPDGQRILDVDAQLAVRTNDPAGYIISIVPEPGVSSVEVEGLGAKIIAGAAGAFSFQPLTSVGTSMRTVRFRVYMKAGVRPAAGVVPVDVRVHGLSANH